MSYIDETAQLLGIKDFDETKAFCYISFEHGIVIEGFKKLYEVSTNNLKILLCDNKQLEILGKNLTIKEISHKELTINGYITNLNLI